MNTMKMIAPTHPVVLPFYYTDVILQQYLPIFLSNIITIIVITIISKTHLMVLEGSHMDDVHPQQHQQQQSQHAFIS
jgi:hypothetical protein